MDWNILLTILDKYGLPTLGIIALAIFVNSRVQHEQNRYDDLLKIVTDLKENAPEVRKDTVENFTDLSLSVEGLLELVRLEFHCAYVRYWMFHNGAYSVGGRARIPFLTLILLAEVVDPDGTLKSMTAEFAQFPLSILVKITQYLKNHGIMVYGPKSEAEKDPTIFLSDNAITDRMVAVGCTWQYFVPVRDGNGSIIGMLETDFTNFTDKAPDDIDPHLSEDRKGTLRIFGTRIGIHVDRFGMKEFARTQADNTIPLLREKK